MSRVRSLAVVFGLMVAACGGGEGTPTTTTPATTTLPPPATSTTTTTAPDPGTFDADELSAAVHMDGDPWVVDITGTVPIDLTIDDIWPADSFPSERQAYEDSRFEAGVLAVFQEPDGILITGAHLFADAAGAATALELIQASFSTPDLVAEISGLPAGTLTDFELLDVGLGDQGVGVLLTGSQVQVIGIIWTTGNLLQFVRAGMDLGNEAREVAAFDVAAAMAQRVGA